MKQGDAAHLAPPKAKPVAGEETMIASGQFCAGARLGRASKFGDAGSGPYLQHWIGQ
ncbi:hypothetical protein [Bradyrhizobium jicamae]|uniref:hypothetical protein n=1 Tax=Bradyrhizobium jicamae TaxID=280332 RepID=UPI001BACC116|nr:hypothetical protein [Bradyrhizobium jicamae]